MVPITILKDEVDTGVRNVIIGITDKRREASLGRIVGRGRIFREILIQDAGW